MEVLQDCANWSRDIVLDRDIMLVGTELSAQYVIRKELFPNIWPSDTEIWYLAVQRGTLYAFFSKICLGVKIASCSFVIGDQTGVAQVCDNLSEAFP